MTWGCGQAPPRWNVVLVTFDTTRADRIGCYGDEQASTPVIDRLAAEGVLFEQAMTSVPITLPAHSTLMTGKVPFAHGVRDNGIFVLGEQQRTLAEVLRDEGYRTAAAIASFPLLGRFGIGQGFELFDDHISGEYEDLYGERVFPKQRLYFDERPAAQVNAAVMPWLEKHHQEPFFLWLHYFDPHHPLQPPAPYDQTYAHDLYRGEIAYADESLGVIMDQLRRLEVDERTLVIFTSDHGEGLGEHNEATHSMLLYQSTLHVPLVMRLPGGIQNRRVEQRVGLVDVMPTVLDLLQIPTPEGMQGRSLAAYLTQEQEPPRDRQRELYAETLSPRLARNWGELRALVVDNQKYVHGPRRELFDLSVDARELRDLVNAPESAADDLQRQLERYLQEHAVEDLDASIALDAEAARKLQALGYLQSAGQAVGAMTEELRSDGDPPQQHVHTISAYSQAKDLLFSGRLVEGKVLLLELLQGDPQNPHYLEMLFQTELRQGRHDAALAVLGQLQELDAPFPAPQDVLEYHGLIMLGQQRVDEAETKLRQAQALEESAVRAYHLARIYDQQGKLEEQQQELETALQLDPTMVPARIDLAITHALSGDNDTAELHFRQAVDEHPYDARAHYNLGAFLVQQGQAEPAIERFRRAVVLSPGYLAAHYALFEQLDASGDLAGAAQSFEALHRLAPGSHEAQLARQRMGIEP